MGEHEVQLARYLIAGHVRTDMSIPSTTKSPNPKLPKPTETTRVSSSGFHGSKVQGTHLSAEGRRASRLA